VSFSLDQVVPWGRSFEEYVAMFSLTEEDLAGRILGCGDGPASFNCELTRRGGMIVSLDPNLPLLRGGDSQEDPVDLH